MASKKLTRRAILQGAAVAAGGAMLPRSRPARAGLSDLLPHPSASGIEHVVVVVMMENRSFDHLLA